MHWTKHYKPVKDCQFPFQAYVEEDWIADHQKTEISIKKGDIIVVYGECEPDGHNAADVPRTSKRINGIMDVKYPVFDKGKNYSGSNILKKKILIEFIEKNFLKELKTLKKAIIIPLGNTVSSTIEYLNSKYNLKLTCFLKGFPHPSGANARKNIQFKENKRNMKLLLRNR